MLISVIIPAYNLETKIKRTLESLLAQTYKEFEVILVNDGSLDNTLEAAEHYKSLFNSFRLINQNNSGLVRSLCKGFLSSSGEYILFLDGDDYVGKDFINNFVNEIKSNKESDIIAAGFYYHYMKSDTLKKFPLKHGVYNNSEILYLEKTLLIKNSFSSSNTFFVARRNKIYKRTLVGKIISIYEKYPFFEGEDTYFSLLALNFAKHISVLEKTNSYYYCIYETRKPQSFDDDEINNLNNIGLFYSKLKKEGTLLIHDNFFDEYAFFFVLRKITVLLSEKKFGEAKIFLRKSRLYSHIKKIKVNLMKPKNIFWLFLVRFRSVFLMKIYFYTKLR